MWSPSRRCRRRRRCELGVELLGAQRGVEVGEIVPADHRRGAGGGHARLAERGAGELRALEHGDPEIAAIGVRGSAVGGDDDDDRSW